MTEPELETSAWLFINRSRYGDTCKTFPKMNLTEGRDKPETLYDVYEEAYELVRRSDIAAILDDELSMVRSVKDEHDKDSPQFKNAEAHERKLHELVERFGVEDQLYADVEKKSGDGNAE